MKNIHIVLALAAISITSVLGGCISVKRETEPTTTTTTRTTPSVFAPSTTTVERTTTY